MSIIEGLIAALILVESGGDAAAVGDGGKGVGVLQIHPAVVADVNRIAGTRYTLRDRLDESRSAMMAIVYLSHWGEMYRRSTELAPTEEVLARIWNGGPNGWKKTATLGYWDKVKAAMQKSEIGGLR